MGVKDLWNIISPISDRRPIFELQGKAIAIDLSGWIVDSQSVTEHVAQPKMYLRNLFFRTAFLLMHEISPVFVLEGTAPSLKHKTIAKRNEIRNGPSEKKTSRKGGRSHFNRILKECEEMLKYMGISCIRGQGEAEAMCALLNAEGLVDGCISQDSDCFLYGAKVVYRNFCTSTQGNRGTSGGSIDEYAIEKIERIFGMGRNKMIALALLCGCDYDEGLNGVGKEAALKLFKVVNDDKIIDRMRSWKTDSMFARMEADLANPNICTTCGHSGKMRAHVKSGCRDCGTLSKCNDSYKEKRALISNELSVRKKALLVEDFPNQELINEFMFSKDPVPTNLNLQWNQPQVLKFVNFMEKCVMWETEYSYAKILPLLTRWQVRHLAVIPDDRRLTIPNTLVPEKIKKSRNIKGVATFEIVWQDEKGLFKGMNLTCISDKENDSEESPVSSSELATLEPQYLVQKCYPLLVEEFENAKLAKKKKPAKPRARKAKSTEDVEKGEEKKKAQRRPRKPKTDTVKNRKMDEFIKTNTQILEESFEALTITPKRKKIHNVEDEINSVANVDSVQKVEEIKRLDHILNGSLLTMFNELTPDDFPSDVEDENMSEIIENICSRSYAMNISPLKDNYINNLESYSPVTYSDVVIKPTLKNKKYEKHISSTMDIKSNNESGNLDCTLKNILDSHKNSLDNKKKVVSIMRSPNIFAKKFTKKFDIVNFTFEQEPDSKEIQASDSKIALLECTTNYKISEDCAKRSIGISNILKSKALEIDDSIERLDRINASLERFLFANNLCKEPTEPRIELSETLTHVELKKETDESKVENLDLEDSKILERSKKFHPKHSLKKRNRGKFSLERSLHVQNLMKDFKNCNVMNESSLSHAISKRTDEKILVEEVDVLNSSLERLRFAQPLNIVDEPEIPESCEVFNISDVNNLSERMEVVNSSFELLQIMEKLEDEEITVAKEIYNPEQNKENNIEDSENDGKKRIIPDNIEFTDESDMFDFSNESQNFKSSEIAEVQRNCVTEERGIKKSSIISHDEEKCIQESTKFCYKEKTTRKSTPNFDDQEISTRKSTNFLDNEECSFSYSTICNNQETSTPKANHIFDIRKPNAPSPTKILEKFSKKPINTEQDESIDEFDLLISNCKPLDERLKEKMEIVRTSTPDLLEKTGNKFSFGIDDLLNDTGF